MIKSFASENKTVTFVAQWLLHSFLFYLLFRNVYYPTILFYVLIFEANFQFLLPLLKSKFPLIPSLIVSGIVSGLACTAYLFLIGNLLFSFLPNPTLRDVLWAILLPTLYSLAYTFLRHFIFERIRAAENRSEKSQAALSTLKAQVNPHFFFNTLNSLFGTALEEKAPRTAESIDQLSGIMRYTMNEAQKDFTAVANEIKFLEDYLHLQRLRLPARDNIQVKTEINYDGKPCFIAPMLLIPFIENAFKYGISIDNACWVYIRLNIENEQLYLLVENKLLKDHTSPQGQGTGIENTKKRLQLLYPDRHKLIIQQEEIFKVELTIDLRSIAA